MKASVHSIVASDGTNTAVGRVDKHADGTWSRRCLGCAQRGPELVDDIEAVAGLLNHLADCEIP